MSWTSAAGGALPQGGLWIGCALFIAVVAWNAPAFLTMGNLLDVLRQVSITGTIAIGVTFVIISGRLDLSVGSGLTLLTIIVMDPRAARARADGKSRSSSQSALWAEYLTYR